MALHQRWRGTLAAKFASERRLRTELTVQLPLERRFGTHLMVKLALQWRSWAPLNVKFAKKGNSAKIIVLLGQKQWFSKFRATRNRRLWLSSGSNGSGEVPSDDDFAENGRWKLHRRPGMPKLEGLWTLKTDLKLLGFLVDPRSPVDSFV